MFSVYLVALAATAGAFDSAEATKLVNENVNKVVDILKKPELQGAKNRVERHSQLRIISEQVIDWSLMAQRSIGRPWKKLKDEQKTDFTDTFKELLAGYYLRQLDQFQGNEKVSHVATEKVRENFVVKMLVTTEGRTTVPIDFYINTTRKVYDVSIEGISITNHYRQSFKNKLINGTFDELMVGLKKQLDIQKRLEAKKAKTEDEE